MEKTQIKFKILHNAGIWYEIKKFRNFHLLQTKWVKNQEDITCMLFSMSYEWGLQLWSMKIYTEFLTSTGSMYR